MKKLTLLILALVMALLCAGAAAEEDIITGVYNRYVYLSIPAGWDATSVLDNATLQNGSLYIYFGRSDGEPSTLTI